MKKRLSPFEQLRREIDLALLTHRSELEKAHLEGRQGDYNVDFCLGYAVALQLLAARADDIYNHTTSNTVAFLNKKETLY